MPTGYTAAVEDGTITELSDFALRCARAFGALISMREDSLDTPIPDSFPPDDYYTKRLMTMRDEAGRLESLTVAECIAAQNDEIAKARSYRDEYRERKALETQRYTSMLEKVRAWKEPSPDHAQLKTFMAEQLEISMDTSNYEPSIPTVLDPSAWRANKLAATKQSIADANKYLEEELERVQKRTEWVRLLKAAL